MRVPLLAKPFVNRVSLAHYQKPHDTKTPFDEGYKKG
jgi:hypothetical protein